MNNLQKQQSFEIIEIASLWSAVARHKGKLIFSVLLVGLATYVFVSFLTPKYLSQAQILIENNESAFMKPQGGTLRAEKSLRVDKADILSQVQVMKSRDLAQIIASKLQLANTPQFINAKQPPGLVSSISSMMGMNVSRNIPLSEKILIKLKKNLRVYPIADTRVITVSYKSKDPVLAAKITNATADAYIKWQQDRGIRHNDGTNSWLGKQTQELRSQVEDAEARLEAYRIEAGLTLGRNSETLKVQQLSQISTQLTAAKSLYSEANARAALVNLLQRGGIHADPEVLKSPLIQRLLEQRVRVQRQVSQLAPTLLGNHPKMRRIKSELASIKKQIRVEASNIGTGLKNEAEIARKQVVALEDSLDDLERQTANQGPTQGKLRVLEREASSKRALYESYIGRYGDTSARRNTVPDVLRAEIFQRAYPSYLPVFPNKGLTTLLAAMATLFFGLALIITRELLVPTVRTINRPFGKRREIVEISPNCRIRNVVARS